MKFEAAFGGVRFRVEHDTANPNATLRVPRPGRVVIAPLKDGGRRDNLGARATRLDAAGDALIEMIARTANGRLTAAEALGHREFVFTKLYRSA